MAPKAAATKKASKPKTATSTHAPFAEMIKVAILNLKERNGSSRQAIKKYIKANNNLGEMTDARFNTAVNRAIAKGVTDEAFDQPKGASGPVKIRKTAPKTTGTAAPKSEAKPAKATTTKAAKPAATKKAPAKKATTAKPAATKKTTTATKANASKPRTKKAAAPSSGPAVAEEKSVVLGKTKSGRVTKSAAPAASKGTKKAAPKKAATTKKAATKKSTTPKKAEAAA